MSSTFTNKKSNQNLGADEQTLIDGLCKFYRKLASMGHREFKFDKSIVRRDSYLGGSGVRGLGTKLFDISARHACETLQTRAH